MRTADEFKLAIGFTIGPDATAKEIEAHIDEQIAEAWKRGREAPGMRYLVRFAVQRNWPIDVMDAVLDSYRSAGWSVDIGYGFASTRESVSMGPREW